MPCAWQRTLCKPPHLPDPAPAPRLLWLQAKHADLKQVIGQVQDTQAQLAAQLAADQDQFVRSVWAMTKDAWACKHPAAPTRSAAPSMGWKPCSQQLPPPSCVSCWHALRLCSPVARGSPLPPHAGASREAGGKEGGEAGGEEGGAQQVSGVQEPEMAEEEEEGRAPATV